MRPSTYNVSLSDALPRWVLIAILAGTLAIEAADLWRQWPDRASLPTITWEECWELCAWSQVPVSSWEPARCGCGAPR